MGDGAYAYLDLLPVGGVVYWPKNFEEGRKYPVIEHIYGGPQTNVVPRGFASAAGVERIGGQGDFSPFAALGFAVVTIDARGTPWRSKAFHDVMWKKHDEFALEDHVAALEQLGGRSAPDAAARPVNLTPHAALASKLEGKMLIVYGEHDENSLPASTVTLIDALIDANRDFDLLLLPNRDHFFTQEPYFIRRRWDYFVRHLLGAEPPSGYSFPQQ